MRVGKIYVLRNEHMKELLVKVGKTLRTAQERAAELTKATGVAGRFEVLFQEEVADVDYAEQLVHDRLRAYRLQPNREFFQVPYELAIRTAFDACREVNKNLPPSPVVRVRINMGANIDAKSLMQLLDPYRGGDVGVTVHYENENAACDVFLSNDWSVTFSLRLMHTLRAWLGDDRVLFVRRSADSEPPETGESV